MSYEIIRLIDRPALKEQAAEWFHRKWGNPLEAYRESMEDCLKAAAPVPQWYVAMEGERIVGGMGVIENDFHNRKDLAPNICAVYTEEEKRGQGIAGALLNFVCRDMAEKGIDTLYLLTGHTGFYERYGWEFLCMVQGDGEEELSRMYVHRMEQNDEAAPLYLKAANPQDIEKEWAFVRDMPIDENGLTNQWHGISRADFEAIALPKMLAFAKGENLPEGYVPETFLFLWQDEEIVGQFRIRHYLTDALRNGAGHIGYFIRKDYREKGYGTKGLALTLDIARKLIPEEEIYLRVNRNNPASLRVMQHNSGVIHHEDERTCYVRIAK